MIKKLLISKLLSLVKEFYPEYDERTIDKIRYGIEAIYLSITKIIVIFFVSFILGILKETLILLFFFNILRFTGFGLHASKSWMCLVSSSLIFIGCPLVCLHITIPRFIVICLEILCLIDLYFHAPADTIKRPLKSKKKRLIYKALTCIICITYLLLSTIINNNFLVNTLLFAMIIEALLTDPLIYKLFKLPYNNYIKYIVSTV